MLYVILEAGAFAEKNSLELGHVHPNNVVLNEDG